MLTNLATINKYHVRGNLALLPSRARAIALNSLCITKDRGAAAYDLAEHESCFVQELERCQNRSGFGRH